VKNGDEVRVVSMGARTPARDDGKTWSLEPCGTTCAANRRIIGAFRHWAILPLHHRVCRIEALTGQAVLDYLRRRTTVFGRDRLTLGASGGCADACGRR
jgi:alanyl-tRNA synthetase